MSDFNYNVRIPTDEEYDRLMDTTDEDIDVAHWYKMYSWVDDPKYTAKYPGFRILRGYLSPRCYKYVSEATRRVNAGFRPVFEPLDNNSLPADIADGDVIVIGTLYMDGKPVRMQQIPTWNGDIEHYIPGVKLEFKPAIDDSRYQVQAIKCGDVFICDRCLLKYISYKNILAIFPNDN